MKFIVEIKTDLPDEEEYMEGEEPPDYKEIIIDCVQTSIEDRFGCNVWVKERKMTKIW